MYEEYTIEQLYGLRKIYVDLSEGWAAYRDGVNNCSEAFLKTVNQVIEINESHIKEVDAELAKRNVENTNG